MEPLFFKAENVRRGVGQEMRELALQWSRFFSKRKTQPAKNVVQPLVSFNGAAFFQSGKRPARSARGKAAGEASMEPLFFKAENHQNNRYRHASGDVASMEPLFFKAENP